MKICCRLLVHRLVFKPGITPKFGPKDRSCLHIETKIMVLQTNQAKQMNMTLLGPFMEIKLHTVGIHLKAEQLQILGRRVNDVIDQQLLAPLEHVRYSVFQENYYAGRIKKATRRNILFSL